MNETFHLVASLKDAMTLTMPSFQASFSYSQTAKENELAQRARQCAISSFLAYFDVNARKKKN